MRPAVDLTRTAHDRAVPEPPDDPAFARPALGGVGVGAGVGVAAAAGRGLPGRGDHAGRLDDEVGLVDHGASGRHAAIGTGHADGMAVGLGDDADFK